MYFFLYRLYNTTTCLKIVQLDIIFDLRKKFRQVIQIFALIQKRTRAENDLAIGKRKISYTRLHIMEFPEKEMMSAKHPETFLERLS